MRWPAPPSLPIVAGHWTNRGDWRSSAAYQRGDLVNLGGPLFLATVNIEAGASPATDSRWLVVTGSPAAGKRGSTGSQGATGGKGPTGQRGPTGQPGARGLDGDFTPVNIAWVDIILANGWTANATNPPQYGKDSTGSLFLRGVAEHIGATSTIVATIPPDFLPRKRHALEGSLQAFQVLGLAYVPSQRGRIIAATTAIDLSLDTSYKADPYPGDPVIAPEVPDGWTATSKEVPDSFPAATDFTMFGTLHKPVGQQFRVEPPGGPTVLFTGPLRPGSGVRPVFTIMEQDVEYSIDNGPWQPLPIEVTYVDFHPGVPGSYTVAAFTSPALSALNSGYNAYDVRIHATKLVYRTYWYTGGGDA